MQYSKYKDVGHVIIPADILEGDVITLKDGKRGKVSNGPELAILSGKRGKLVLFDTCDVVKIDRRRISRVRIYQIKSSNNEYIFRDYENVRARGRAAPPADIYAVVYDGYLDTDNLDDIFHIFNVNRPHDYIGRSLTMSDIIELYDITGSRFFYCDFRGFRRIHFKPVELSNWYLPERNDRNDG